MIKILAFETSCDDTSVAIVNQDYTVDACLTSSQFVHNEYGGVVPEIASRLHLKNILPLTQAALNVIDINDTTKKFGEVMPAFSANYSVESLDDTLTLAEEGLSEVEIARIESIINAGPTTESSVESTRTVPEGLGSDSASSSVRIFT